MGRFVRTMRDDFDTSGGPATATPLKTAVEKTAEQMADERHQRRQKIRDKLAAEEQVNFKYQRALDDLEQHEIRSQSYNKLWRDKSAPIENELSQIEQQQMQNASDGKPADETLAERRTALNGELLMLKTASENQRAAFNKERERLDKLQIAAARRVPTGKRATERDLFDDGDKRLLAIHELAKLDSDHAIARFDLLQSPILNSPRAAIDAQRELVESLTLARRAAFEDVVAE